MIRLARLASYVLITAALAAQQLPDGADLSKQAQAAAKRVHSMQFNSAIEMEMGTGMKMTMESSTAIVNPDKSRTEVKAMGNDILNVPDTLLRIFPAGIEGGTRAMVQSLKPFRLYTPLAR